MPLTALAAAAALLVTRAGQLLHGCAAGSEPHRCCCVIPASIWARHRSVGRYSQLIGRDRLDTCRSTNIRWVLSASFTARTNCCRSPFLALVGRNTRCAISDAIRIAVKSSALYT